MKHLKHGLLLLLVGHLFNSTVVAQGRGFCGEEEIEGLVYLRARMYNSDTGLFLTKDPIGIADGANQYLYVHSNPINYVDRTGLITGVEDGIAIGIGVLVGLGGQLVADLVDGDYHWEDYVASGLGGGIGGNCSTL